MAEYLLKSAVEEVFRRARRSMKPEMCHSEYEFNTRDHILLNAEQMVHIMESADVQAVTHGEWIEENRRPRSSQFYCSVCHRTAYDPQPTRSKGWVKRCRYAYCPNCGAKMKEG